MDKVDREGMRLNRYIGESGVCSRRAADRLIEEGKVTIDGRVAVLGDVVSKGQKVCVEDKEISLVIDDIILLFNKPVGITCTSDPNDPDNVIDYINYPKRIYSIGRLDKESEGLLLMTNNGDLANRIMRARYDHDKEYIVSLNKPVTDEFIQGMINGVYLDGNFTRKCEVRKTGECEITMVLRQGINRQIRRMCAHFDYEVTRLVRVRVANILLGDMRPGRYRDITKAERAELYRRLGL